MTTRDDRDTAPMGADMRNVVIENVFYNNADNEHAIAFDIVTDENSREYPVQNFVINKAFLGNCKRIFHFGAKGEIRYTGVFGSYAEAEQGVVKGNG